MKNIWWKVAVFFINSVVKRITGKHVPRTADAWRAVQFSYSHFGEDLLLLYLLKDRINNTNRGVYVDVGAFHPILFSNTYLLHQHGWIGINIDANSDNIDAFKKTRPNDITLIEVLSDREEFLDYLYYPTSGLNRSIPIGCSSPKNEHGEQPYHRKRMLSKTLEQILNEVLPIGTEIDLLTIDCEGNDLKVLSGLNLKKHSPLILAIEGNSEVYRNDLQQYLCANGYSLVATLVVTQIYKRN